jgi:hypothetical protein
MTEYRFADGFPKGKLDAQKVGNRLAQLEARHGALDQGVVLAEARKQNSPLRKYFEWDDTKAAHQYRIQQAGALIRAVILVRDDTEDEDRRYVRAFVNVIGNGERNYMGLFRALSDEERRTYLVRKALKEFETTRIKYNTLDELATIFAAIDELTPA